MKIYEFVRYHFLKWKLRVQAFVTVIFYEDVYPCRNLLLSVVILLSLGLFTGWVWTIFPLGFFVRWRGETDYFIGLGAAVFGVLAIAFSLQSLVMQNTAENRSAGLYEIEGKDRIPTAIFIFLSLVSLSFFFLGVWVDGASNFASKIAVVGSLPVLACVLWALYALYRHTFARLSPMRVIGRVERSIRKDLRWMARIAKQHAIVLERRARDPDITLPVAEAVTFGKMKPRLQEANRRVEFLFDYHDKLLAEQEHYAARSVLDAIRRILLEYLNARRESSIRYVVSVLGASVSDSQDFLISNLEDLASRGKQYIRSGEDRGATHVIGIFRDIVVASTNVKFYPERRSDNPMFMQCRGYFEQIVDEALVRSATEALFKSVSALEHMGAAALQSRLDTDFHIIMQKIHQIGVRAARTGLSVVWSESIRVISGWMRILLSGDFVHDMHFVSVLETWVVLVTSGLRNGMQDPTLFGSPLAMPLLLIDQYIHRIFTKIEGKQDETSKRLRSTLLQVIERFKDKLYIFSEGIKTTSHPIINETSRLIVRICEILFKLVAAASSEYEKREPRELLHRFVHFPARFIHDAGKSDMNTGCESLIDGVTQIGLLAYKERDEEIAKEVVGILSHIASEVSEEKVCSYGNIHAPRIMAKACYFGILALKDGKSQLLKFVKEQLVAFEVQLGTHQEEMLNASTLDGAIKQAKEVMFNHVAKLRDEKRKYRSRTELIFDHDKAQHDFLEKIEVVDIDRFTKEIWNSWMTPSQLDKEIEQSQKNMGATHA